MVKKIGNNFKLIAIISSKICLIINLLLITTAAVAQENNFTANKDQGEINAETLLINPWVWIFGIAAIILLIALITDREYK